MTWDNPLGKETILGECHGCGVEDIDVRDYGDSFPASRFESAPFPGALYLCEFCANTSLGNDAAYPSQADFGVRAIGRMIAWSHHRIMREIQAQTHKEENP